MHVGMWGLAVIVIVIASWLLYRYLAPQSWKEWTRAGVVQAFIIAFQYVPVRARVVQVQGLSAHADYREMLDWFEASKVSPRRVFVTHGEPASADAFRRRLRDSFGWDTIVPEMGERRALD